MPDLAVGSIGQPDRTRSVRRDLPDVQLVVEERCLIVARPARHAERRLLGRGLIGFQVHERGGQLRRHVGAPARLQIHRPEVIVLEEEEIAVAGTGPEVSVVDAGERVGASTGLEVDRPGVGVDAAHAALHCVGIGVHDKHASLPCERRGLFPNQVGDPDESIVSYLPCGEHGALPFTGGIILLARHHRRVFRMPDLHVGQLVRIVAGGHDAPRKWPVTGARHFRRPRGHAEVEPHAIVRPVRPAWRREANDAEIGRQLAGGGVERVEPLRRGANVWPGEDHVRRPFAILVCHGAERRQRRRVLPPPQTAVGRGRGIERVQPAGRGVVHVHAVADTAFDGDGKRQERPLLLPRELRDGCECRIAAGGQLANQERRPRGQGLVVGRPLRRRAARRFRRVAMHGHVRSRGAEGERLDAVDDHLAARGEFQQPKLLVHGLLVLAELGFFLFGEADPVGKPPRVVGECRPLAEG